MTIVNFTPVSALVGGALIGLGAAGMWWLLGRIAGVSSVLGNTIGARGADLAWRLAFIAGLLGSGIVAATVFPDAVHFQMEAGYPLAVAAGLLVGFGDGGAFVAELGQAILQLLDLITEQPLGVRNGQVVCRIAIPVLTHALVGKRPTEDLGHIRVHLG